MLQLSFALNEDYWCRIRFELMHRCNPLQFTLGWQFEMIEITFDLVGAVLSIFARFRMIEFAECVRALWIESTQGRQWCRTDFLVVRNGHHLRC